LRNWANHVEKSTAFSRVVSEPDQQLKQTAMATREIAIDDDKICEVNEGEATIVAA